MKLSFYIFSLLLITVSACAPKSLQYRELSLQTFQKTGFEIENSIASCSQKESLMASSKKEISSTLLPSVASPEAEVTKGKNIRYANTLKTKRHGFITEEINPCVTSLDSPLDEEPEGGPRESAACILRDGG